MGKTDEERNVLEDLREHKRVSVAWDARVKYDEKEAECRILDASLSGVRIETKDEIKPGIDIELDIPDVGVLTGKVVWSISGRAGILLNSNPDTIRATLFSRARLVEGTAERPQSGN